MDSSASIEELEQTLASYQEQFEQIEALLKQSPNEELLKIKEDLVEVINLTENLLRLKKKPASSTTTINYVSTPSVSLETHNAVNNRPNPAVVSQQPSTDDAAFRLGERCSALWTEDGQWYEATIEALPSEANGNKYYVTFVGYGNSAFVDRDQLAPSTGSSAPSQQKYKNSQATADTGEDGKKEFVIPKSLKILPTDSDDIRVMKRKKIKALKSQWRKEKQEEDRSNKKSSWQMFTSGAGKMKGTTKPKESIFRSPDSVDGRVGVTGSGKGLTPSPQFKATELKVKKETKLSLPIPTRSGY